MSTVQTWWGILSVLRYQKGRIIRKNYMMKKNFNLLASIQEVSGNHLTSEDFVCFCLIFEILEYQILKATF